MVIEYKDFNKDGNKEVYMNKVAQFGTGMAFDFYDTIIVKLIGDSLDYPFFVGSYWCILKIEPENVVQIQILCFVLIAVFVSNY